MVMLILPAAGAAAADEAASYQLGPADILDVKVIGQPDLETVARVDGTGKIVLPYIGEVTVGGMPIAAAIERIEALLAKKDVIRNPQVTVSIQGFGRQAAVLGYVNAPATVPLDRPVRLSDVLARAGGVKPDAATYVVVRHRDESGKGKQFDLKALLEGGDDSVNPVIESGDTVYVPAAPVFYLYGYVNRPGSYPLRPPMTVIQALAAGGGLLPTGSEGRIRLKRRGPDDRVVEIDAEMDDLVQPEDTIVVPERWF